MLSSDTAGTPLGNRSFKASSWVPGETSVTVPLISMGVLNGTAVSGAETVIELGPLPIA
jgi:hypothetical protein